MTTTACGNSTGGASTSLSTLTGLLPLSTCIALSGLLVPIALPKSKHFVPTFHNCLVSRLYILELAQDFKGTGSNTVSQHGTLRVPIQVTSEPREGQGSEEADAQMYGEPDEDDDNDDEQYG